MTIRAAFALLAFLLPVSALAATPTASYDVGSVHVDRYGTGTPPLVLIPGLTDSAAVWETTIARYAPTHTVYALTLPGFGGRKPVAPPVLDTVDHDIATLLATAGKPVVIGHSLGGFLAIRLAEEHSDLLAGAIAIDGLPVYPGMDKLSASARSAIASSAAAHIAAATPAQFAQAEKAQLAYMTKPENVATAQSFSQGADIAATAAYTSEMLSADLRPGLSHVTVPLLEIAPFDASVDSKNPYVPMKTLQQKQAYYRSLFAGDPSARVVMVDDSRHFIMLDQPAQLFSAIDAFLAALPASP